MGDPRGSSDATRSPAASTHSWPASVTEQEVEVVGARLRSVTDQVRCYLANEEQILIASLLERFPEEFALHLEGRCSKEHERRLLAPKIVDIVDGAATWDEKQARKQPDWTFDPA